MPQMAPMNWPSFLIYFLLFFFLFTLSYTFFLSS